MLILKKFNEKIPLWKDEIMSLNKIYGDKVISECTISQVYGGMRGVRCLSCDTSVVEPDKGLIIRGKPILDLINRLPEDLDVFSRYCLIS